MDEDPVAKFDREWKSAIPVPVIEEWLQTGRAQVEDLQTLIELELLNRKKLGHKPLRTAYLARFPANHHVVEAAFTQAEKDDFDDCQKFGDYLVVDGTQPRTGGMASVWQVKRYGEGDRFAAKVFRTGASREDAAIRAEIDTLKKLASSLQHVVRLDDYGISDASSFFIMPWYEQDLHSWCCQQKDGYQKKDIADVLRLLSPVIRDLDKVHKYAKVIHRDIKPSNLLFDAKTGCVLLSDFGLAKRASQASDPSVWVGTKSFTAPSSCDTLEARC